MRSRDLLEVVLCPMCGAIIGIGATACPECGELRPGRISEDEKPPRPASTGDIVFAVIVGVVALALTLPGTIAVSHAVLKGNLYAAEFLANSILNVLVWGLPLFELGYWWRRGIVRGYPERTYLWRVYHRSQSAALGIIIGLLLLLLTICAVTM
jgi:ABC-type Na+ efflux pump permease subunit